MLPKSGKYQQRDTCCCSPSYGVSLVIASYFHLIPDLIEYTYAKTPDLSSFGLHFRFIRRTSAKFTKNTTQFGGAV